jgi:hypothetical protein
MAGAPALFKRPAPTSLTVEVDAESAAVPLKKRFRSSGPECDASDAASMAGSDCGSAASVGASVGESVESATPSSSACTSPRSKASSKFRGVCWLKKRKAWRARIEVHGKREHLGYFDSEELAARAYDRRSYELNGVGARLNFPDEHLIERPSLHSPSAASLASLASKLTMPISPAHAHARAPAGPVALLGVAGLAAARAAADSAVSRATDEVLMSIYSAQIQQELQREQARRNIIFVPQLQKWAVTADVAGKSTVAGLFDDSSVALTAALALQQLEAPQRPAQPDGQSLSALLEFLRC